VKYECLTGIKAHNTLPEGNLLTQATSQDDYRENF